MLIGLMSLPNQVVYVQFHPVAYMVKLNIEMSMASLITRLAKNQESGFSFNSLTYSHGDHNPDVGPKNLHMANIQAMPSGRKSETMQDSAPGIHRRLDVEVTVERPRPVSSNDGQNDDGPSGSTFHRTGDEVPLTKHAGHPTQRR